MKKTKDPSDELFDNLHDGEQIQKLRRQAKKEKRIEKRKEWWNKNNPIRAALP